MVRDTCIDESDCRAVEHSVCANPGRAAEGTTAACGFTGALRESPTEDSAAPSSNGGAHGAGQAWGAADEHVPSGHAPNSGEAAAREPDVAPREPDSAAWPQGSAAKAHLIRRSSLKAGSGAERRGSGGSPSRLSRSSFLFEENGGPAVPALGDAALPDLSFMLADTLVLPQK